jgi:two-component system cell cycle response regulator
MSTELDKLLLSLSVELLAAKENLSAVNAFKQYLKKRYQPAAIEQRDHDGKTPAFAEGRIHLAQGDDQHFLLALSVPIVFTLKGAGSQPEGRELDLIEKMVRFFGEGMLAIAELKGLTHTDDLTGLFNQRYLELILDREISLAKRNDTEFSVLFLDLDHFKKVNDTHGHLIGSRLLYEVGQEIKRALRDSDICFRYGGDEFVIILSHTGLDDAIFVAERVRQQIEKKRFLARENMDIRLTASIGVATVPLHAATKTQILKAADEALYGVKKAVRNRVIAAASTVKE